MASLPLPMVYGVGLLWPWLFKNGSSKNERDTFHPLDNSSFDGANICSMNFGFSLDSSIQLLRGTVLVRDILPVCSERDLLPGR